MGETDPRCQAAARAGIAKVLSRSCLVVRRIHDKEEHCRIVWKSLITLPVVLSSKVVEQTGRNRQHNLLLLSHRIAGEIEADGEDQVTERTTWYHAWGVLTNSLLTGERSPVSNMLDIFGPASLVTLSRANGRKTVESSRVEDCLQV